jgi:hypothetical protein
MRRFMGGGIVVNASAACDAPVRGRLFEVATANDQVAAAPSNKRRHSAGMSGAGT